MTGYFDYMLLLRPDERICAEINSYKKLAAGLIGNYPSMGSTAHISIVKFPRKKPYIMRPAIEGLQPKLKNMQVVTLQINNFKFFVHKNNTYTIYAVIEATYQSDNWFAALGKQLRITKSQFTPHITIARSINENSFYKLWPHFKYIIFRQRFMVNSLTVLERETLNNQSKWIIFHEFIFEHKTADSLV
jgi:2'-5' RNA ligase